MIERFSLSLDFLYQEAFLTTYRTFITPSDLLTKLMQRYTFFARMETKKKMARYAFSLLMRVIDEIEYVNVAFSSTYGTSLLMNVNHRAMFEL